MVSVDDVVVSVGSEGTVVVVSWLGEVSTEAGTPSVVSIIAGIGVIAAVQQHQEAKGHHAGDDPHC